MTDRDCLQIVDDSEDEQVEVELIDLTSEEDHTRGPVDLYQSAGNRPNLASSATRAQTQPNRSDNEIRLHRLADGTIIRPGDTVEMHIPPHRNADAESSGDFLKIVKICKEHQTGQITLQGHRFMREKYLIGKDSDGEGPRLNEVVQHLVVREDDDRPGFVQGLEEVPIAQVERKRAIDITEKPFPMLSFRDKPASTYEGLIGISRTEQRRHIFQSGALVCRWSRTSIISPNGGVYGGIYRHVSKTGTTAPQPSQQSGANSSPTPHVNMSASSRGHGRTLSLEELSTPHTPRTALPAKKQRYKFFDMFCGNGGASRGADQAGLTVMGGLDHNETAMEAWEKNNPGGIPLCMDSFEFLKDLNHKIIGRCDILNISNPCQTFSPAHTWKGKNDEVNIKQLKIIKPLIEALKPRVVVLENTTGLVNFKENRKYFNKVLNSISTAGSGYNLRYMIVNMADYGLPQVRKRVVIIAARKGTPLPPFPKPTHGPSGNGLKPYVSIGDALKILDRLHTRAESDLYHTLHKQVSCQERLYDPFAKFIDCIVTKGVTTPHWSGEKFTPRELALLQSLPYHHYLAGSWNQAIKQVGNMFPPLMAELVYRTCAQTLEAFDNGFITADEDIDDLNVTLIEKGIDIPEISHTPTSLFDLTGPATQSPYQYLSQPALSDANHVDYSSAWAKRAFEGYDLEVKREKKRSFSNSPSNGDGRDDTPSPAEPKSKRAATSTRESSFWQHYNGKTIELSDSEEEVV
ncbi:S-adenosyl-L-methionine-dependent methyltransferase [Macroventuria anomochaeta]|uniref:S-adenosyl-L-methionine-dependent methyltransferase n=1 Tax=Macroventuria anomochaeta TaxID=301207 RepID=A0ACB6S6U5_9PLEO|nr:S-adenosyl-L-methionine-dependent methyltransferase [Macroventuria anomochaeta]KAF2629779.1 S-adenosyl-L-methionine-dependent methyltransferase [Macroventuria anomochaeta]